MGTVRFLLALCVVATHSPGGAIFGITMMSGITAVQCFYVISGFLITMILNEREEYRSLGNFYLSRYLRLWPVYILIAALTFVLFQRDAMLTQLPSLTNWPALVFIAISNLTIFFQDWFEFLTFEHGRLLFTPVFQTLTGPQPYWFALVPQAWTLGVELTFYAIAPFVCRRWWGAVGLLVFGICVRLILAKYYHLSFYSAWLYRFAPAEMMMFGAGAVAYFVGRFVCPRLPRTALILCCTFMFALAYIALFDEQATPFIARNFGGGNSLGLLILDYPVLLLMAFAAPSLFYGTKNMQIDRLLGELSYPMYVCHIFVFSTINAYLPASVQTGNALYVVCVIAVSLALVLFVISPIDRVRRNLAAPTHPIPELSPAPA